MNQAKQNLGELGQKNRGLFSKFWTFIDLSIYRKPKSLDRKQYTFMPDINYKSRSIMMAKGRDIHQTEENLINYGKQRKESLKQKIQDKENREIAQHWFRPTLISNKSLTKRDRGTESNTSIHKRLYDQAIQKWKQDQNSKSKNLVCNPFFFYCGKFLIFWFRFK